MEILKGIGASKGIAIGELHFYKKIEVDVSKREISNPQAEIERFKDAHGKAIEELDKLYNKALAEVGEQEAMIFDIHKMMLDDLDYLDAIYNMINEDKVNAEYAVNQTAQSFSEIFSSMDDEYMRERAADVIDISDKVIRILQNAQATDLSDIEGQVVLMAKDFMPSETVGFDKNKILAFVTEGGSKISHSAILARTIGIPAVVGVPDLLRKGYADGTRVIVDGFGGELFVEPDLATVQKWAGKRDEYLYSRQQLLQYIGKPSIAKNGKRVEVNANIGHPSDIESVEENDAEGIGLFRSEFIYMESNDFPSEEKQFEIYKSIAQKMAPKRVIVRTLDLGADKQADYFDLGKEDNPAMGYRAVRICLDKREIFYTQLRALYRASAFGNISIMVPMIISVEEVLQTKKMIAEILADFDKNGIKYAGNVEFGIMIETPAAVMISDELAKEVDFFSVGTNDLTQYTLAADRMNSKIEHLYNPRHKAVLRMIRMAADNAHKNGKWIGICGESASDLELTEFYLAIGIDELSVTPTAVLDVRKRIIEAELDEEKINKLRDI